jgi:type IX secretion system PorP/SprF family membrane protein
MKKASLIFFLVCSLQMLAQQDPQYSLYMFNGLSINPAYAGSDNGWVANLNYRYQWVGMEGAPRTMTANVSGRYAQDRLGTGLMVMNDQIGIFQRNHFSLSQAYHLRFTKMIASFGLRATYEQMSAGFAGASYSANQGAGATPDAVFTSNQTYSNMNFGAGFYLHNNKFWVGYSAPSLMKKQWNELSTAATSGAYRSVQHLISAGYIFNYGKTWSYKTSMMLKKHEATNMMWEAGAMVYYSNVFGAGISRRGTDAWIGMMEFQIGNIARLMYAYDFTSSGLANYNSGTHELMLKFFISNQYRGQVSPRLF